MNSNTELYLSASELKKFKVKRTILRVIVYAFLTLVALFIIIPFYWMIITAFKTSTEINAEPVTLFPHEWTLDGFKILFAGGSVGSVSVTAFPLLTTYLNTVAVGFFTTLGVIVTTVLAAFAFSRLEFKGRELVFTILLMTMMIPGEVFVITNYMTVSRFNWVRVIETTGSYPISKFEALVKNYLVLILPFMTSVFYTFYLRQTFRQIPNELYLSAKVDGTSDFKYLLRVMIPMAKATITTIIILSMIGTWNAYVWPSLVTNGNLTYSYGGQAVTNSHLLVSNGLSIWTAKINGQYGPDATLNVQMAASAVITIPILIVFFIFKKQIMRGVSRNGIKG